MATLSYPEARQQVVKVVQRLHRMVSDINELHLYAVSPKTLRGALVDDLDLRWKLEQRRLIQIRDYLQNDCLRLLAEAERQEEANARARHGQAPAAHNTSSYVAPNYQVRP
jgi:hypothetical protein